MSSGIRGSKITLLSYDDGYSPTKAVEKVRRLVENDQVLLTFQIIGTPPNAAVQRYLNDKKSAAAICLKRRDPPRRSRTSSLDLA
jgi:ABC-type branched-subunit amino acid transport system substrate-binding protein